MSLRPRYIDLLDECRVRHRALWDSLILLEPDEWTSVPMADELSALQLLDARMRDDRETIIWIRAAAVGLDEPPDILPVSQTDSDPTSLLDEAVLLAGELDDQLVSLDNHQWARKLRRGRGHVTVAWLVNELNAAYSKSQRAVDLYLGSYKRLGKGGVQRWLRLVYDEIMDSVAGLSETEMMGEPWHGDWNTYQLMEHVWGWNAQLVEIARRWREPDLQVELVDREVVGAGGGPDMIAVADGIVTAYRQISRFVDQAEPALLQSLNNDPWGGRSSLCTVIYEFYRHAWRHAQEIRAWRASGS